MFVSRLRRDIKRKDEGWIECKEDTHILAHKSCLDSYERWFHFRLTRRLFEERIVWNLFMKRHIKTLKNNKKKKSNNSSVIIITHYRTREMTKRVKFMDMPWKNDSHLILLYSLNKHPLLVISKEKDISLTLSFIQSLTFLSWFEHPLSLITSNKLYFWFLCTHLPSVVFGLPVSGYTSSLLLDHVSVSFSLEGPLIFIFRFCTTWQRQ